MNRNKLKTYAPEARRDFIQAMKDRAAFYGLTASKIEPAVVRGDVAVIAGRDHPRAIADKRKKLEARVERDGFEQTMEALAYTWFNRLVAIRFMEVNGYLDHGYRVLSHPDGKQTPEIIERAEHVELPGLKKDRAIDLKLEGNKDSELYRLLLTAQCNALHAAMPFLFERIDDETELLLPDNLLHSDSLIRKLVDGIDEDDWKEVEVIGWLYQFYISEKKDEVFAGLKKNVKITVDNIPAATQLFTPHWIVRYLVENSLGRLWMLNRPASKLALKMNYYIAPEKPEEDFLRIARPEDIKVCDLACGSGHILTYAFDVLQAIYEEEGYTASEIPDLILSHNLYGIEIDERAGALAAFALVMKAAGRRKRFLWRTGKDAVHPNICVLENVSFKDGELADYVKEVGRDLFTDALHETLGQFTEAKNFGSLIVPKLRDVTEVRRVIAAKDFAGDMLYGDVHVRVQSVLRMADFLSPKYHVVVANPPYMGSGGMNPLLKAWLAANYRVSKSDLMTCFMERCIQLVKPRGYWSMINLPSWMFLSSFDAFRRMLISTQKITSLLHLGRGIFGADFGSVAFSLQAATPSPDAVGEYRRLFDKHVDVRTPETIETRFLNNNDGLFSFQQTRFKNIPGSPIAYWLSDAVLKCFESKSPIASIGKVLVGLQTGDNERFIRNWYEVSHDRTRLSSDKAKWVPYVKGGEYRKWYGNQDLLLDWSKNGEAIISHPSARPQNRDYYFRSGITYTNVSSGAFSARFVGEQGIFDQKGSMIFIEDGSEPRSTLAFLLSKVGTRFLEILCPTIDFNPGSVGQMPILSGAIRKVAAPSRALVQMGQSDWDAYETSWDFTTQPLLDQSHRQSSMEQAYNHLRTNWRSKTKEMQRLEEDNNHIFIEAYGLEDELTPEVPLEEITLTCNPAYRYGGKKNEVEQESLLLADTVREFVSYAVGCMFGRYSLDAPGLILANQGDGIAEYLARVPNPTFPPDADNVIPILDGDWFPDDVTVLFLKFLQVTFGEARFQDNLTFIEEALGKDIRRYFASDFFSDHVKRYRKRPIYWLVSSGRYRAFQCLIYLHRYNESTLARIRTEYVIPLQGQVTSRIEMIDGEKMKASSTSHRKKLQKEQDELKKQQVELLSFDEKLKHFADQKINLDLDDGVKANYGKFGDLLAEVNAISGGKDDE